MYQITYSSDQAFYDGCYEMMKRWFTQYSRGELTMENAIAVSRRPSKVITGDTYHLAGKDFKSKDEAIRYAVELAGGLTVTKMTTIAVEV